MKNDLIGVQKTAFDEIERCLKTARVVRKVILGDAVIQCAHFLKNTVQDQGLLRIQRI